MSSAVRPVVRKKAALCLLRLFRRNPDVLNKEDWYAHPLRNCARVPQNWVMLISYVFESSGRMRFSRCWTSATWAC